MSNHVHFIGVPEREDSMGRVFKYLNMQYSQYFNRKISAQGHLFQGRFFSSVMSEKHTLACARYIERNPIRAKIVKQAWDWQWSSASIHCEMRNSKDKLGVDYLFEYMGRKKQEWREFIEEEDNPKEIAIIREKTRRGCPLGEEGFIKKLEKELKLSLSIKPPGRPKKKK